jgi:hypothetical protein
MNNEKLEKIFKIQLINLVNDLLIVFSQDTFLLEIKNQLILKINNRNFFPEIKEYFNKDIEQCIIEKNHEILFQKNYTFVPTSKEDILKLKLERYWNIMSISNKDKVWDYLNILLKIYKNMV